MKWKEQLAPFTVAFAMTVAFVVFAAIAGHNFGKMAEKAERECLMKHETPNLTHAETAGGPVGEPTVASLEPHSPATKFALWCDHHGWKGGEYKTHGIKLSCEEIDSPRMREEIHKLEVLESEQ